MSCRIPQINTDEAGSFSKLFHPLDEIGIPALYPGPSTDVLVAHHVMGWRMEMEYLWATARQQAWCGRRLDNGHIVGIDWRPSEVLEHAWQLVERLMGEGWRSSIGNPHHSARTCFLYRPHQGPGMLSPRRLARQATASTVPLAICQAALMVRAIRNDSAASAVKSVLPPDPDLVRRMERGATS